MSLIRGLEGDVMILAVMLGTMADFHRAGKARSNQNSGYKEEVKARDPQKLLFFRELQKN